MIDELQKAVNGKTLLRPPQFSLQTLLILFFCLAVGSTIGIPTSFHFAGWTYWWGIPFILFEVLLATGSTAILIGLLQQVGFLKRLRITGAETEPNQAAARRLAIGWRIVVAALLTVCLLAELLAVRGYLTLHEWNGFEMMFGVQVFPQYFRYACLFIVLCDIRNRSSPSVRARPLPQWLAVAIGTILTVLVLAVLSHNSLVHFLVYRALADVEAAQPAQFLRAGAYPNHQGEGYWFFWLSFSGVLCLVVGAAILYVMMSSRKKGAVLHLFVGGFATVLLGLSVWYGVWYHSEGLVNISPEFAEAGLQSDWIDWLVAGGLLVFFLTAASAQIATRESRSIQFEYTAYTHKTAFHESLPVLIVLVTAAGCYLLSAAISEISTIVIARGTFGVGGMLVLTLTEIDYFFPLALSLLILQIAWRQRKYGPPQKPLCLPAIDGRRFVTSWLALLVLTVIGIPTIAAFSFSFWLGPWNWL